MKVCEREKELKKGRQLGLEEAERDRTRIDE